MTPRPPGMAGMTNLGLASSWLLDRRRDEEEDAKALVRCDRCAAWHLPGDCEQTALPESGRPRVPS